MSPFKFGNPVDGEYYLDRPALKNSTAAFLESGINVVLVGPRRFGKTSFILDLLHHLEQNSSRTTVFVDIFNITSHRDFLQQLISAVKKKSSILVRLKDWVRTLPSQFRPILTMDENSNGLTLQFVPHQASDDQIKQLILSTLDSLGTLSPDLCLAIDEFQSVAKLEDGGWLEATLREKMQQHRNIAFLFSGSRRSVIHDMFNNSARPFYRTCQLIDFPVFGSEFTDWIAERFHTAGIVCPKPEIEYLRDRVSNTPNYVQMVCFHLVAAGYQFITRAIIDEVIQTIVKQNAYAYQTLMNTLTPSQQRVLRLAAHERESVFAKENLAKYDIKTPAHLSQALNSLKSKQILDESTKQGRVVFDDPLFALWLNYEFPE